MVESVFTGRENRYEILVLNIPSIISGNGQVPIQKKVGRFFLVICNLVPPPSFMRTIIRMKLPADRENSNYFMRLGNTALSQ